MTDGNFFLLDQRDDGVCTLTLNRPDIHNAFDDRLIADLTACFERLGKDGSVRAVVLTGEGKSFSAGADLNWMRRMAGYGKTENLEDARGLANLMTTLDRLPKPTIAKVNGAALGGGVGLVCCCDIAIASDRAVFGTTEVRLGLIPSVIGPYVVAAIGGRHARKITLTGERFDAFEALRIGLVHQVEASGELDAAVDKVLDDLLASGPEAIGAGKTLLQKIVGQPITDDLTEETARTIADLRATPEAKEGLGAFLEKRSPDWRR
ncbi:MAG: enoyl-CoA hydratase/isomerase family protein [Geminicoccales bacterium]